MKRAFFWKIALCAALGFKGISAYAAQVRIYDGSSKAGPASYVYDTSTRRLFKGRNTVGQAMINYTTDTRRIIAGNTPAGKILFTYVPDNHYAKLVEGQSPAGKVAIVYDKFRKPDYRFKTSPTSTTSLALFREGKIIQGSSPAGKVLAVFSDNYNEMPEAVTVYIASQLYLKNSPQTGNTAEVKPVLQLPTWIPVIRGSFEDKDAQKNIQVFYYGGTIWIAKEGEAVPNHKADPDYTVKRISPAHVKFYEGKNLVKPAVYTFFNNVLYSGDVNGADQTAAPIMLYADGNFSRPGVPDAPAVCHADNRIYFLYKGPKPADGKEPPPVFSFPSIKNQNNKSQAINLGTKVFLVYKLLFEKEVKP